MKKQTGIWIDSSKAIVVTLASGTHDVKEIESDIENKIYNEHGSDRSVFKGLQHVGDEKKLEERKKHLKHDFLKEVVHLIQDDDEWYVFGPAETKTDFTKLLRESKSINLDKLKAVEPAEKMTLNEIVAKVKHFYTH